jgi:hypothetical protein
MMHMIQCRVGCHIVAGRRVLEEAQYVSDEVLTEGVSFHSTYSARVSHDAALSLSIRSFA